MPVSPGSRFRASRFRTVSVSGSGAPHFAAWIMSPIMTGAVCHPGDAGKPEQIGPG